MNWLSGFTGRCIDHAFEQSDARSPYLGIVTVKQFLRERDERIELAFISKRRANTLMSEQVIAVTYYMYTTPVDLCIPLRQVD